VSAIEIRDLFRVYSTPEGEAAALQGLSLSVDDGEIVAVLGPSGSGKTTLLRIVAGLERPSAGTIRVAGLDLGRLSPRRRHRFRSRFIGYVEQHYTRALAPELTARELVALPLGLAGVPPRERRVRAEALLDRVGLLGRRDALPAELSGGEQQRVAVCAAIAGRPRLLVADEPTGELDRETAALVYGLLGELLREEGCAALIVSHDPRAAEIADRAVQIRDGRVSTEWTRDGGDEEAIVVGRGGWLRLPEDYLLRAGIGARVSAELQEGRVVLRPATPWEPTTTDVEPAPEQEFPLVSRRVGSVSGLEKVYGAGATRTHVLNGLTASFESARFYAVTGRSGSGKTTFLHLLAGLEVPTRGDVTLLGVTVSSLDRTERAAFRRAHVGFVGQQPGLVGFLTAEENVVLGLALRGVDEAERADRAATALEAVGLEERAGDRVAHLSMGERVRVAVARALALRPAFLLVDEPTARLDQANAQAVAGLLRALAREHGTTIVCATHDPVAIEQADEEFPLGGMRLAGFEPAALRSGGARSIP
jgi:ABC-type lipoprotein export system ATPase subunit